MAQGKFEISITDMPEVIWELRRQMASILREEAEGERPDVAKKLRAIADDFEVGGKS